MYDTTPAALVRLMPANQRESGMPTASAVGPASA